MREKHRAEPWWVHSFGQRPLVLMGRFGGKRETPSPAKEFKRTHDAIQDTELHMEMGIGRDKEAM